MRILIWRMKLPKKKCRPLDSIFLHMIKLYQFIFFEIWCKLSQVIGYGRLHLNAYWFYIFGNSFSSLTFLLHLKFLLEFLQCLIDSMASCVVSRFKVHSKRRLLHFSHSTNACPHTRSK